MINREKSPIYVDSEIGELEEVIIHTPGPEIEVITPLTAEKLLYNDILPLSAVKKEYAILRSFLSKVAKTTEVRDVLQAVLSDRETGREIIESICVTETLQKRKSELLEMGPAELCSVLVSGLKSKRDTLESFLSEDEFDYFPLPNLYFTRDSAMVYLDNYIAGSMAYNVREPEALLMKQVFINHYGIKSGRQLFDGTDKALCSAANMVAGKKECTIEGGDFLVLSASVLIIGISERTTPRAIDIVAEKIYKATSSPFSIYCVILPKKRETIHLDMVFNIISKDEALVYEPYITGDAQLRFVRIDVNEKGERSITIIKSLLKDLARQGYELEPVFCGGSDARLRQREQWLSGNNFFAFAPGRIIGYDCNEATLSSLENAGYDVVPAENFISGEKNISGYKKIAVTIPGTDLARGGGGVRCMTLPVRRKPFDMKNK